MKIIDKCATFGCATVNRNEKNSRKNISTFRFSKKYLQLFVMLVKFVNRREWRPTSCSVLCEKYFKENFIIRVKSPGQRSKLKWTSNPIPTIHSEKVRREFSIHLKFATYNLISCKNSLHLTLFTTSMILTWLIIA